MTGFECLALGLLVIVGAEAFSRMEITELSGRGQSTGRVSVDVDVDRPVDQIGTHIAAGQ